jgi:hypothetical protein
MLIVPCGHRPTLTQASVRNRQTVHFSDVIAWPTSSDLPTKNRGTVDPRIRLWKFTMEYEYACMIIQECYSSVLYVTDREDTEMLHGRMVLCGQRTSSVCSTQIRNEPFGSGKVKLIDAFKDNWYQNNSLLNRCFHLTDYIGCSRLGSEVYSGPSRMHVLQ